MSSRNKEAAILAFFRSGPPEAVKLMFNLVKGAMKERFGTGAKSAPKATRKPRKSKDKTSAGTEAQGTAA